CFYANMTENLFLAKTNVLKEVQWDPVFKLGEHEDFFYRFAMSGAKSGFCRKPGFWIKNDHGCLTDPKDRTKYAAQRGRHFTFWRHLFKKYNLTSLETPAGEYKMVCTNSSFDSCYIPSTQQFIWWEENDSPDKFFETVVPNTAKSTPRS